MAGCVDAKVEGNNDGDARRTSRSTAFVQEAKFDEALGVYGVHQLPLSFGLVDDIDIVIEHVRSG
jgi:hypothetical protein